MKGLRISSILGCMAGAMAFSVCGSAYAQDDDLDLVALLEIKVVTASKTAQSLSDAPATIRVITSREIKERGYKDLKDVFRDLPGFDVSENLEGEVRTLAIARGILGANKLMVLKDGKRVNAITGERLVMGNNMPLFNVERIEVMYGPGSVLYGADAYSGVVNIITKGFNPDKPYTLVGDVAYGTENRIDAGVAAAFPIHESINTDLSFRWFQSDGIDPTNFPEFDDYTLDYAQPIRDYEFYWRTHIGDATLTVYRQDGREPGGPSTLPAIFDFNDEYVWHQKITRLSLDHNLEIGDISIKSTVGYEHFEVDPDSVFYYSSNPPGPQYKFARNMSAFLEEQLQVAITDDTLLLTGFSLAHVDAFAKGNNLAEPFDEDSLIDRISYPDDPSIPEAYRGKDLTFGVDPYVNAGAFLEVAHHWTEKLITNAGVRYDYNTDYSWVLTPRAGVVYKPLEGTNIKALYGQAYIQPSRYLAGEHWSAGAFGYYPNPDLEPERLQTFQFNVSQRIGKNVNVGLNTYWNLITDLIRPENAGAWNRNINQGDPDSKGFELTVDAVFGDVKGYLYYSYLDAQTDAGDPTNKVASHKVTSGLTYTLGQFSASPRVRWSDEITILTPEGTGTLDGHVLLDLTLRGNDFWGFDVYLTGKNLLNEEYYHASPFGEGPEGWLDARAPQPGINGEIGVRYEY